LLRSLMARPSFRLRWLSEPAAAGTRFCSHQMQPVGYMQQHNAEVQWQVWQLRVLQAMQYLWALFKSVGIAPSAAAAGAPAAAAASTRAAAAVLVRHLPGMLAQTRKKGAPTAASAPASRSSGTTCCACSRAACSGQQQWQRMRPMRQIGKWMIRGRCLAPLQQRSSKAGNMQKH
jgi:hypothetical protein